jgi:membrane associated rhomboid family serine protease
MHGHHPHDSMPGVPRAAFAPGAVLAAIMAICWLGSWIGRGGDMADWGVSALALREGRWWTLLTHIFAHGGLIHVAFNALLTFALSGPIIVRLAPAREGTWRFVLFFLCAGVFGGLAYVALNPAMNIPAIGASGAVFAMIGLMARLPMSDTYAPVGRAAIRPLTGDLLWRNLLLIAILTAPSLMIPRFMGIAWEAHLAGFLFGFFAGPLFASRQGR